MFYLYVNVINYILFLYVLLKYNKCMYVYIVNNMYFNLKYMNFSQFINSQFILSLSKFTLLILPFTQNSNFNMNFVYIECCS